MSPVKPISVAQYGIGPIGAEIARLLLTKPWIRLVAAVDIDPDKIGKDVGEVIGLGREVGVKVTAEVEGRPARMGRHSTGVARRSAPRTNRWHRSRLLRHGAARPPRAASDVGRAAGDLLFSWP